MADVRGTGGTRGMDDVGETVAGGGVRAPAVEREELQRAAEAPEQVGAPQGVLLGAGGDPQMIGLPIFVAGSIALGFALVGVVSPAGLGSIIPIISLGTALGLLISTVWAIFLGQSIVASIFGIFAGFWASLPFFLLGIFHNWFVIPKTDVVHAQLMFFISWDIVFLFLTIICLRLPVIYPAILVLVLAAVTFVVLGLEFPGSVTTLNDIAGICVFAFCALGLYAFLNVGSVSMGGPAWPPLGAPPLK